MGEQNSILLSTPVARVTDPLSSYRAGERHRRSGKCLRQKEIILKALKRNPGMTSAELSKLIEMDRYIVARRLPELRNGGLVRNGAIRQCGVVGSPCLTWYPITKEVTLFDGL